MPTTWKSSLVTTCLAVQYLTFLVVTTAAPTNVTIPLLPAFTRNSNNGISSQCTKARTWIANGFHRRDCNPIIDYIYDHEAQARHSDSFEFTSPGSSTTKTDLPKMMTPRKYVRGTCVVTIAMLDQFRPMELPGSDFRERYEETDVASFEEVWNAALKVDLACGRFGKAGWAAMGEEESIGVLVMTRGSAEDRNIPDGQPIIVGPSSALSGFITLPNSTNFVESGGRLPL